MSEREDRAVAAALDTPQGDDALAVIERWSREAKSTVHLIRLAINRAYRAEGLRAPDFRVQTPEPKWEPRR